MKTIEVIPNPYAAIDVDGIPQGVVGLPGARFAWIGAALDPVVSKETGKSRFYFPGPNEARGEKGVAGLRVVTLEVSDSNVRAAIANAVLEGSLIVVTKDDAAKLGIVNEYKSAEAALADEAAKACAHYRALRGDNELLLARIPHHPTPEDRGEDEAPPPGAPAQPQGVRVTKSITLHHSTEA